MEQLIIQIALSMASIMINQYIREAEETGSSGPDKRKQVSEKLIKLIDDKTPLDKEQSEVALEFVGDMVDLTVKYYKGRGLL